ncbi:PASTA domain-containing protein [Streptomyces sp. NRRL S-87]|uniref:PASTA domain-containing protein n=1 Tax=Streptomyces sp. NRRL S-87 TaxID=1463920 RepID=UPI0004C13C81|nr:PASTA domain-containing protein [Streptomyces sp. NRRL S-87]
MDTLTFGPATGQTGGQVGVPDLMGRKRGEAEQRLRTLGLVPQFHEIITEGAKDTVFRLDPSAGAIVEAGSTVTVHVISTAPSPVDLDRRLVELTEAVRSLETEAEAKKRYEDLLKKLGELKGVVPSRPPASPGKP